MERMQAVENGYICSLVEKVKEGDGAAFREIIRLYQKKVFVLVYSYFQNREDAMDIVQETFLRLHEKINMFQKGKNFQSWLLRIAKNLCIDYYRKYYSRRRELESEKSVEELNLASENSADSHHSSDLKEIFSTCIQKLAEKQRMIFVMKHYNGLQYNEIAQTLNISVGTVKSLHFKAVQNLKGLVSPYLGIQK
jgi:RNA polymerase sigma-70 factor (ECF subfamily)